MLEFDLHKTFQSADSTTKIYCHGNVEAGSITVLYGRSGIGKSTILRMIAGLEIPDDGSIYFLKSCWFSKKERVLLKASSRETGFVFQDYNLFPNMTVERNLRYASPDGLLSEEIVQILRQLNLEHLLKKYPEKLSGGQRQRIAIIRALCQKPKLLLMDEPFSALDDDAINDLIDTLKYLRKSTGMTLLIVSHRKDVVLQLADSVIHMTQNGCTQGSASEIIL